MMGFYMASILDECPGRQCCKLSPKCAAVSAWGTGMHQLLLAKFTRAAAQFQSSDLGVTLTNKSTPTKASNSDHQEVLRRDQLFTTPLHIKLLVSNVEIQQVGVPSSLEVALIILCQILTHYLLLPRLCNLSNTYGRCP